MKTCKACGTVGEDHYVSAVGHYSHPDDAIEPYYYCTGETALVVNRRLARGLRRYVHG